jgi:hypothetical protein
LLSDDLRGGLTCWWDCDAYLAKRAGIIRGYVGEWRHDPRSEIRRAAAIRQPEQGVNVYPVVGRQAQREAMVEARRLQTTCSPGAKVFRAAPRGEPSERAALSVTAHRASRG